jgi:hypothetical protein
MRYEPSGRAFTRIDPVVLLIQTFSGRLANAGYERIEGQWVAHRLPIRRAT